MTELRLHRGLYGANAIDEAVAIYAPHAEIAREVDGDHVVLRVTSDREGRAERVAKELANYALGLTVQGRDAVGGVGALANDANGESQ
ncbi:MAG: HxsD-like protein [Myxococcales bacterium]|nr:HxsD-like protein [Myxococcales bacterium]